MILYLFHVTIKHLIYYIIFAFIFYRPYRNFLIAIFISLVSLGFSLIYIETHECTPIFIHWLLYVFPPNRLLDFLFGIAASIVFIKFYAALKNRIGILFATFLEIISLLLIIDRIFFKTLLVFSIKSPSFLK